MACAVLLATVLSVSYAPRTAAQSVAEPSIELIGNHPAEIADLNPVANADPAAVLRMQVTLGLRNRAALERLLRDQQNPLSPNYHRWLTPEQFRQRFGPSQSDLDAAAQWIAGQGFQVTATSLEQRYVRFSGTVSEAEQAFRTKIMSFGDGSAYANISDPLFPARFDGVISSVRGLDNFLHSTALSHYVAGGPQSAYLWPEHPLALLDSGPIRPPSRGAGIKSVPQTTVNGITAYGPSDFYYGYVQGPLLSAGINGGGPDCLAIVGDSDFSAPAVALFNKQFGLPSSMITTVLVDGTNPGINGAETESLLDLEWSHVVAPNAAQRFYLGNSSAHTPDGSIVDAIQRAVNDNACGTIGVSFSLCGAAASFYTGIVSPIYAQAAAQGQSIFIASGDWGAAGAVASNNTCVPGTSRNINELGGDPNVTEVGGSSGAAAWNTVYRNSLGLPEQLATGGGASAIYQKPDYQKGPGVPADGARDVPDVAMMAATGDPSGPGVFFAVTDIYGNSTIQCCLVGTSLSAQLWAGISKLLTQGVGRQGPLNPRVYALANANSGWFGLYDITTGNNNYGKVIGFKAGPGFDQTTGWGTVNDLPTITDKLAPAPIIDSIPSAIQVGSSFPITGRFFSPGAKISLWISDARATDGIYAVLIPSSASHTRLIVPIPASVPLGEGFSAVAVVNDDLGFTQSNVVHALVQGSAAAGIPTIVRLNGVGLAPSSSNPSFATDNVETVLLQGSAVTVSGTGFDAVNGVAVNIFCACSGGRVAPVFVPPGSGGLSSSSFSFTLPADVTTGPASLVVINRGADGSYSKSSNAVSVPVGARITVTSVTQSGGTITVNGTGFSTATIINFFNLQGGAVVNLGGGSSFPNIPLTIVDSTQFTFTKPAASVAGPAYVQAFNPPFVPFTSSGITPAGAFTLQ